VFAVGADRLDGRRDPLVGGPQPGDRLALEDDRRRDPLPLDGLLVEGHVPAGRLEEERVDDPPTVDRLVDDLDRIALPHEFGIGSGLLAEFAAGVVETVVGSAIDVPRHAGPPAAVGTDRVRATQ